MPDSAIAVVLLLCTACTKTIAVTETMTWQCLDSSPEDEQHGVQRVRFFFEKRPNYFVTVGTKNLCYILRADGSKTVQMGFVVWGNSKRGVDAFVVARINGKPVGADYGGGMGGYGEDDPPDPLTEALRNQQ